MPRAGWKKWVGYGVGTALIAAAIGTIILTSLSEAIYYYTVDEVSQRGDGLVGERVRVKGNVVDDSLSCREGTMDCTFELAHGGEELLVHSTTPLPDAFENGAEVVADGTLEAIGRFEATEVIAKCPSKYEAK